MVKLDTCQAFCKWKLVVMSTRRIFHLCFKTFANSSYPSVLSAVLKGSGSERLVWEN